MENFTVQSRGCNSEHVRHLHIPPCWTPYIFFALPFAANLSDQPNFLLFDRAFVTEIDHGWADLTVYTTKILTKLLSFSFYPDYVNCFM
jgi:hypothetical protein